jgi:hypothetical protein
LSEKYLLEGTIRRDRSSRFSEQNQVAYFPAVSGGWVFSEKIFQKGMTWLDRGKLELDGDRRVIKKLGIITRSPYSQRIQLLPSTI